MVCFDVVNETLQEVVLPEEPMPYVEEHWEDDKWGCLSLFFHIYDVSVVVWMMQEYGVREFWMKSFSINQKSITSSYYLELIRSFKNNETLWRLMGD